MRKKLLALTIIALAGSNAGANAQTTVFHVSKGEIHNGYVVEKVPLQYYAVPGVYLSGLEYQNNVTLPVDAITSDPQKFEVLIGEDRKQPFAIVRIPVFKGDAATKQVNQLSDFILTITEDSVKTASTTRAAKKTATGSVLANGTWYKIATTQTGLYKIDRDFIVNQLKVDASTVSMSNIRVFGNGGNMLSENNAVPRKTDLVENALYISDANGDNKLDNGDYVVFYSVGPTEWDKDSINQRFTHKNNLYCDSSYYFITFDQGAGLRIGSQGSAPASNETVTSFNDYAVHDSDMYNPGELGKEWYGEQFGNNPGQALTRTFQFNFGSTVTSLYGKIQAANIDQSTGGNLFSFSVNGSSVGSQTYGVGSASDPVTELAPYIFTTPLNSSAATITINYSPGGSTSVGYLNYIELNVRRALQMSSSQMSFRDWPSVGPGMVAQYQVQGANSNTQVWDITNPQVPVMMSGSLSGSTYTFSQYADVLHEFVAMNSGDLPVPSFTGGVPNQNLHGSGQVDYIVVTNPAFLDQANQLADFHSKADNYKVLVATTTQVYNEFSSGGQDISAIRDFARMFYDRAGSDTSQMPKYLVLFGGASYDYKNRVPNNSNFVPTFQSAQSHDNIDGYCTDDFYGFLDSNEYIENTGIINAMDIAVGRIPARSVSDATTAVNKIQAYKSAASLGPWRISATFVADNNDGAGYHLDVAEHMTRVVTGMSNDLYNNTKVYVDAIPTVATPAGARCPIANAAIDDQVFRGTFLINYNGHGNTQVWASERILTQDDYNAWNNTYSLPFAITATCDFGQFDLPEIVSAGEQLVIRNNGGVITALTTTQAVYSGYNEEINAQYLGAQFTRLSNGQWYTFGEAFRIGKNETYLHSTSSEELFNFRKFSILGDPGVQPDFPQNFVHVDGINDGITNEATDSVKALGSYVINGSITDAGNNLLGDFNGTISISFFDKPRTVHTVTTANEDFQVQDNVIYKGKVNVTNGKFSFAFIAPKDLNYSYGNGKLSTYADNGITDAAGADTSIVVGGYSDNPVISTTPPVVRPYMNDSMFVDGGITGANSVLYVVLTDSTGINVSGNSVGHDLVAILDGNTASPYVLNDYYETAPNTYQRGYVSFPISGLSDGKHSMLVRAWDVNDNEGEGVVDFVVVDGKVVDVQDLMNYPNPFRDVTHFLFEHNHPNEQLDVEIAIYNTAGAHVKTIKQSFTPSGSRTGEITWDGTSDAGARLPSGVYVYRLNITTSTGIRSTAYQKLVIVR